MQIKFQHLIFPTLILLLQLFFTSSVVANGDLEESDGFSVAPMSNVTGSSTDEYKNYMKSPDFQKILEQEAQDEVEQDEGDEENPDLKEPLNLEMKDKFDKLARAPTKLWLQQNVRMHNRLRKLHGVKPLEIDYKLCYDAQVWADKLGRKSYKSNNVELALNWTTEEGENEGARRKGSRYELLSNPGTLPVIKWYKEIVKHDWDKNEYNFDTRHFSQVVWKSSKTIGCGRFVTRNEKPIMIIICRYAPPGNWQNEDAFKQFLRPPKKGGKNDEPDYVKIEESVIKACVANLTTPKDESKEATSKEKGGESEVILAKSEDSKSSKESEKSTEKPNKSRSSKEASNESENSTKKPKHSDSSKESENSTKKSKDSDSSKESSENSTKNPKDSDSSKESSENSTKKSKDSDSSKESSENSTKKPKDSDSSKESSEKSTKKPKDSDSSKESSENSTERPTDSEISKESSEESESTCPSDMIKNKAGVCEWPASDE